MECADLSALCRQCIVPRLQMSDTVVMTIGAVTLLLITVVLMWRYLLRGLAASVVLVTVVLFPLTGIFTLERLSPLKLYSLKFSGALFLASLTCLLVYGLVLPVRCWWQERRGTLKAK